MSSGKSICVWSVLGSGPVSFVVSLLFFVANSKSGGFAGRLAFCRFWFCLVGVPCGFALISKKPLCFVLNF